MEKALKPETKIDINPLPPPATFSVNLTQPPLHQDDDKTPFFKTQSRRRRSDTWVTSIFVILHLITFTATMITNDCWTASHGDCVVPALGRMSFQPLSENPLLGPSASTLDKMGALRKTLLRKRQTWRLFSCPWLHAGLIHLITNLTPILFLGIYLEQEFGSVRTGIIFIVSAFFGSLATALLVRDSPVVTSSSALFGLLGATLSVLLRNWKFYANKAAALLILLFVFACNFMLGLLPFVDNYANIGGLVCGLLLGFVLLVAPNEKGLYEYGVKSSFKWKLKLDRPVPRTVSFIIFSLLFAALLVAFLLGTNMGRYCGWCKYIDCIPSRRWCCNDVTTSCEAMASDRELTLTCLGNGNFRVFPLSNISQARTQDLCTLICS